MIDHIDSQITSLVDTISFQGISIATVESCTGGMLSQYLTAKAGSSQWFSGALITYSNESKIKLAGVNEASLINYGPISKEVAEEMAKGGISALNVDLSVSITGLAGPAIDDMQTIGTVWISWCTRQFTTTKKYHFDGNRNEVRINAVLEACKGIKLAIKQLSENTT